MTGWQRRESVITARRICQACATTQARRDGRDQLCLICATLDNPEPPPRPPSRKDTR